MEETEQADEATAKHAAEQAERQAKHAAAELRTWRCCSTR